MIAFIAGVIVGAAGLWGALRLMPCNVITVNVPPAVRGSLHKLTVTVSGEVVNASVTGMDAYGHIVLFGDRRNRREV